MIKHFFRNLLLFLMFSGFFYFLSCTQATSKKGLQRIQYNQTGLTVDLGVGLWAWPLPMDYDQDGDYDLLVTCPDKPYNGIYFFENRQGAVKMPVFKVGVRISKAYRNIQPSYLGDNVRLLVPGQELIDFRANHFTELRKIYQQQKLLPNHKIRANQWRYCDFEGDGDLDLIVGHGDWTDYGWDNAFNQAGEWTRGPLHGYVFLITNQGSDSLPDYAEPVKIQAGGQPIDVYGMPSPNFADFDGDSDLDLICGEFLDRFIYFQNTGTRTAPVYAAGVFLAFENKIIQMDLEMIIPVAFDWDKDGDVDLIVGQEDGRVAWLENSGAISQSIPQFLPPRFFKQEAADVKFGALVTPWSFDWDGDGDEDLICGNTAGYIGFIENLNSGNPPKWAEAVYLRAEDQPVRIMAGFNGSIQGPCEAKWGYTTLSVADWNRDQLPDIIVNSILGRVVWFQNIGTRKQPKLAAAQAIQAEWEKKAPKPAWFWWEPEAKEMVTQWRTTPVALDWNQDGLTDLVMLDHEGFLAFFQRVEIEGQLKLLPGKRIFADTTLAPLQLNPKKAGESGRRKLCFVDWDQDGKLDLMINSRNTNFWRQVKTENRMTVFQDMGQVDQRILAGHTTSPTVVDWDKNGIPDLLVGAEDGYLYYLKNPVVK